VYYRMSSTIPHGPVTNWTAELHTQECDGNEDEREERGVQGGATEGEGGGEGKEEGEGKGDRKEGRDGTGGKEGGGTQDEWGRWIETYLEVERLSEMHADEVGVVCVCVCACVCVDLYVCVSLCICLCMYIHTCTCRDRYTCTSVYACSYS